MYEIRYQIERDFYGYDESEGAYSDFLGDDVLEEGVLRFTSEQWCGEGVALRLFTLMYSKLPVMTEPLLRYRNMFEWRVYETQSGKSCEFEDERGADDAIRMEVDYALVTEVWRAGEWLEDGGADAFDRLGVDDWGLIEKCENEDE